jgi:hypothetical protein
MGGESPNEKDELPALLFREAFFEGGHGLSALADLVENFAVGDAVYMAGVGQIRRRRVIRGGVWAVAFS